MVRPAADSEPKVKNSLVAAYRVSKRKDSTYRSGRSPDWLKTMHQR